MPDCASRTLLIGLGRLADATGEALEAAGHVVLRLGEPGDPELRQALDGPVARVVVVSRFDHVSLRQALLVVHLRPDLPVLVTIFDRDVAAELERASSRVHVLSMADVVAPAFAASCLDPQLLSVVRTRGGVQGVRLVDGRPTCVAATWSTPGRHRRGLAVGEALLRPFEPSARILVWGLMALAAVFAAEVLLATVVKDQAFAEAVYAVAKVTVTVGPSSVADEAAGWYKLVSAAAMLLTVAFIALVTAGLVERLLDARLTGIVGRSAVPRRGHVIVVGLGQVGLRLCSLLRDLGIPVVAVEQNAEAKNVPRAKDQRIPVVIGSGSSRRLLRRLSVQRARALAAVTSDEIENIAVAVAARSVRADLHLTFRAGDGRLTSDSRSLFHVGAVRDVYRLAGAALAAVAAGQDVEGAFAADGRLFGVDGLGRIAPLDAPPAAGVPGVGALSAGP
ncbi:MAG TPA: NAD-binding protein [Baekduia sp.]|nr:NAD-binding protein [Baekduia sp.]